MTTCCKCDEWNKLEKVTQETIVRRIERSCFNACINECTDLGINRLFTDKKFVNRYSAIASRVISNLDTESIVYSGNLTNGKKLVSQLINGEVDPQNIANLTSKQLYPAASDLICESIEMRKKQKITQKVSKAYTCYKCKRNETLLKPCQMRAGDEEENLLITCAHCQYTWKI